MKQVLTQLLLVLLCATPFILRGQTNETVTSGAFIIDMGVLPQTVGNGLKPYGMLYDLIKNYSVPIKWVVNGSKIKDGIDFTYNAKDYKGGPFIVPAEYRNATINARIAYWQTQGVVGTTTTAAITVPVLYTLRAVPTWTINTSNSYIAESYLTNAGIPATAYNFLLPDQLTCCNDLFVMPHADPTWLTHKSLLTWNQTCKGSIWAGCHAVSVLEGLFDPSSPTTKMNFLSDPSLLSYKSHAAGSPPYTYAYPTDPVMQFMGTYDGAQQNGSEQMYMPVAGGMWRATTKIGVYDPTQANVPANSPGPAASTVFGRAFGDNNRGYVMYESGHNLANGTVSEQVAAQRAFLNFSFLQSHDKVVVPIVATIPDTMYSSTGSLITFTLPAPFLVSDYTIQWSAVCGGTFTPNGTQQTVTYTPPSVTTATPCLISVQITDACGRKTTNNKIVTIVCSLTATAAATNPACSGGTGSIALTVSGGTTPYSFNWNNGTTTGSGSGTTISALSAATYAITVTAANGCTNTTSATITAPTPLSIATPTVTNVLCKGSSTGAITISPIGGTSPYTFNWGSGVTTQNRSGLAADTYTVTVTDANSCTATTSATVTEPTTLTASTTQTNNACFGASTGSITLTPSGGTSPYTFNWGGGITTQNRSALAAGTYTVTVTDANSCTKTATATITQPAAGMTLSTNVTNISCGSGTGSIALTINGGTSPYTFNWGGGITTQNRLGLAAGTYTVTVTDANSCTATNSATVSATTGLTFTPSVTNVNCFGTSTGAINLTASSGNTPYTFNWDGGVTTQNRTAIAAGTYNVTVTDAGGCTGTTSATVTQPASALNATASATNVACNGGATGAITLTPSGGTSPYTYDWGGGITTQNRTALAAGNYSVTVTDAKGCTQTISQTITQPSALALSVSKTDVSCTGGTDGAITLTVTGGTTAYSYNWGGGITTQNRSGLSAGTYSVTVTDANGCTASVSTTLVALKSVPSNPSITH